MNAVAPPARQGEAAGLLSSAQLVGILMGPAMGSLLASGAGYTAAFVAASATLFAAAIVGGLFLPRQAVSTAEHVEQAAGANRRLFAAAMLLVYGLAAVLGMTNGVVTAIWSIYMRDHGAGLPVIGLSYTVFAIPAGLLMPLAGRLSDRWGRFWPAVGGFALYTAIYIVFGFGLSPNWLVALSSVEGCAAALAWGAVNGLLADAMPVTARGKAQANFSAATTAGSFFGATAAGFLYGITPGAPFTFVGMLFGATTGALFLPGLARLASSRAATLDPGGEGQAELDRI